MVEIPHAIFIKMDFCVESELILDSVRICGRLKTVAITGKRKGNTYCVDFTATKKTKYPPIIISQHKSI